MKNGDVFGTLCAFDPKSYHFSENEISLLKTMGELISHTIDLENLSIRDSLTGLYNRAFLRNYFQDLDESEEHSFAAIFIDLDNFKLVNDTFGHSAGDELVSKIASRLKGIIDKDEFIVRWGGDEFVILLTGVSSADRKEINLVVEGVIEEISKPVLINEYNVKMTASIGISFYPENGMDMNELLKKADITMYSVKQNGKNNFGYYESSMEFSSAKRFKIENALRDAVKKEQLSLHYQPIFHLPSNKLVSFEALLRWNHPELGNVSPADFIPIAEETGLIVEIGDWVIRQVCEEGKRWLQKCMNLPIFSVNLSVVQFENEHFVDRINEIFEESGFDYNNIVFEITESMLMKDIHFVKNKLANLEKMGIKFSIDDFGTGYSSLSYLSELPIKYLKLDKSFTMNLFKDKQNILIAKSIINLAHNMGIACVAEGIETDQQLAFLQEYSADFGQGYHLGRPMAAKKAMEFHIQYSSQTTNQLQ